MEYITHCSTVPDELHGKVLRIDGMQNMTLGNFLYNSWDLFNFPLVQNPNWQAFMRYMQSLSWIDEKTITLVIDNFEYFLREEEGGPKAFLSDMAGTIIPFWVGKEVTAPGSGKEILIYCVSGDKQKQLGAGAKQLDSDPEPEPEVPDTSEQQPETTEESQPTPQPEPEPEPERDDPVSILRSMAEQNFGKRVDPEPYTSKKTEATTSKLAETLSNMTRQYGTQVDTPKQDIPPEEEKDTQPKQSNLYDIPKSTREGSALIGQSEGRKTNSRQAMLNSAIPDGKVTQHEKVLLAIDVQEEFGKRNPSKFKSIVDFVNQAMSKGDREYTYVIGTMYVSNDDNSLTSLAGSPDNKHFIQPLAIRADTIIKKLGIGLPKYRALLPKDYEYHLVGYGPDTSILKIAMDLKDRGYDFKVIGDLCDSAISDDLREQGLQLLFRIMPDAII